MSQEHQAYKEKLATYAAKVLEWNEKINITGAKTVEDFEKKHIQDVVEALKAYTPKAHTIIDVGTGGGIPGIPLHLLTEIPVVMSERRGKKAAVVLSILEEMEIENCEVLTGAFEELWPMLKVSLQEPIEIWMRAFLPGPKLAKYFSEHFDSQKLPRVVLMKGPAWAEELEAVFTEQGVKKDWMERFKKSETIPYEIPGDLGKRVLVLL